MKKYIFRPQAEVDILPAQVELMQINDFVSAHVIHNTTSQLPHK
jgi:hypothetical protein